MIRGERLCTNTVGSKLLALLVKELSANGDYTLAGFYGRNPWYKHVGCSELALYLSLKQQDQGW